MQQKRNENNDAYDDDDDFNLKEYTDVMLNDERMNTKFTKLLS